MLRLLSAYWSVLPNTGTVCVCVQLLSNVGAELSLQLPMSACTQFPQLFSELEARGRELGIETYGTPSLALSFALTHLHV